MGGGEKVSFLRMNRDGVSKREGWGRKKNDIPCTYFPSGGKNLKELASKLETRSL